MEQERRRLIKVFFEIMLISMLLVGVLNIIYIKNNIPPIDGRAFSMGVLFAYILSMSVLIGNRKKGLK